MDVFGRESVVALSLVTLLDRSVRAVVRQCRPEDRDTTKTRWFLLHALCNLITGTLAAWDVVWGGVRTLPLTITLWLHVYHCLLFPLSRADLLHHVVFLPLLGVPPLVWTEWGVAASIQMVFINGYPGMVLYGIAGAYRLRGRRCAALPYISVAVNTCVRMPGILAANYHLYHHWPSSVPSPLVLLQLTTAPLNAIYYTFEAWSRVL